MLGNTYDTQVCSIARALELVGERWTLLILRNALFAGSTRYRDFQRSLGIATNVLQDRLDGLVEGGIMERRPSAAQAGVTEYVLTQKGRDFAPALVALTQWGDTWAAPDGPPILYRHTGCGSRAWRRADVRDARPRRGLHARSRHCRGPACRPIGPSGSPRGPAMSRTRLAGA